MFDLSTDSPLASLQSLFGGGDPLFGVAARLADSYDPIGRADLLDALSDRFEASVLFEQTASPVSYSFATGYGEYDGRVSIFGAPEPLSQTLRFLRPNFLGVGVVDGPLSLGDLINLTA